MDYRGKTILITGGPGFIGSNLAIRTVELGQAGDFAGTGQIYCVPEYCRWANGVRSIRRISTEFTIDAARIEREPGWKPAVRLVGGIAPTLNYCRKQPVV